MSNTLIITGIIFIVVAIIISMMIGASNEGFANINPLKQPQEFTKTVMKSVTKKVRAAHNIFRRVINRGYKPSIDFDRVPGIP